MSMSLPAPPSSVSLPAPPSQRVVAAKPVDGVVPARRERLAHNSMCGVDQVVAGGPIDRSHAGISCEQLV